MPREPRYWNFWAVCWLDSCPGGYEGLNERASTCGIKCFISPVHNMDKTPAGEYKKPHAHVIIMYSAPHSKKQGYDKLYDLCGDGFNYNSPASEVIIEDIGVASRYLCHIDNPDKYHYAVQSVKQYNGAEYSETIRLVSDSFKYDEDICDFIELNNITHYHDLYEYTLYVNPEWKYAVCKRTTHWTAFLKARKDAEEKNCYNNITRYTINEFKGLKKDEL